MAADEPPRFVLFLPPPPSPASLSSLRAAFGDTVSQVLREVASHSSDTNKAAILEVASACPYLVGKRSAPRSSLYDYVHSTLASVYKLFCVIAAKEGIDIEDADGVDVRLLPVAWSPETGHDEPQPAPYGPLVDLPTLAKAGRKWQYAFGVESEAGEAMVKAFVVANGTGQSINRVQSGPVMKHEEPKVTASNIASRPQETMATQRRHHHVAVGGTFDHIHIGHKLLLTMTVFSVDEPEPGEASSERTATIGITGDQLLKNKKHAEVLESWDERQHAVQAFLESLLNFTSQPPHIRNRNDAGPNGKSVDFYYPNQLVVKCTEIQDPFGPTITEEQISTLVISGETRSGGKAVNDKRREKGWAELDVFEVDVLDAEDEGAEVKEGFGSKLSSTAIREKLARKRRGAARV